MLETLLVESSDETKAVEMGERRVATMVDKRAALRELTRVEMTAATTEI